MTTRFNVLETDYERGIILNLCALFLFLLYPAHRASPSSESSRHFLLLPFEAAYSPHIPTPGAYYSVVIMSSLLLRPPFSPVVSPGALLLTVVCRWGAIDRIVAWKIRWCRYIDRRASHWSCCTPATRPADLVLPPFRYGIRTALVIWSCSSLRTQYGSNTGRRTRGLVNTLVILEAA